MNTENTTETANVNKQFDEKLDNKRRWTFFWIVMALYILMISSKNLYTAEIVEIIKCFKVSKASASMTTSAYFASYAVFQFVVAKFIDKINIKWFLTVSAGLSAILILAVPFCGNIYEHYVIFFICGILQAGIWPSVWLLLNRYLSPKMMVKANSILSVSFSFGFFLDYMLSALFIEVANWKVSFIFFGGLFLISVILFYFSMAKTEKVCDTVEDATVERDVKQSNTKGSKYAVFIFLTVVSLICFFGSAAYYSISGWMPNLLFDIYKMPSSLSTFLTLFVPLATTVGPLVVIYFSEKYYYWNVLIIASVLTTVFSLIMIKFYDVKFLFAFIMSALILVTLRGINNASSTVVILKNRNMLKAGSSAAILNAAASLGASAGPTVSGYLMEKFSWSWLYISAVICSVAVIGFSFMGKHRSKVNRRMRY